jgi:hypothetical protein
VSASWILLDWSRVLNEFFFYFSDSHSKAQAKLQLRDHSSATTAEKFFLKNGKFESTFVIISSLQSISAKFAGNHSK